MDHTTDAETPIDAPAREARSFCRICAGNCGIRLKVVGQRVVDIRGDKSNPLTRGFACIKGLRLHDAHNSPQRLLHPLKRLADGSFAPVPLEQALDEIAARLRGLIDRHGADAIAGYRGTLNYSNLVANYMLPDWLHSLGSRSFYSTMTIDQSAKWVTADRLGSWAAGYDPYELADVLMFVGTNPLVSLSTFNCALQDPVRALRDFKARGGRLVVIDPRRTETARHADVFLQPVPGEDPTLLAGLLRIILAEGWHDAEFCRDHVQGLDALQAAVEPFTLPVVASRAGVDGADVHRAAELFARLCRRGSAASGTGPNMAAHSNLAEHLLQCINVVCGRFARPGDPVQNPGVIGRPRPWRAEVVPPRRSWETGPKSHVRGYGMIFGERMTAALPDEIVTPGSGQIRALFVDGGNPAVAIPDQRATIGALSSLDLLVTIDPFMTATARLSHYILPPKMMLERADLTTRDYEAYVLQKPYAAYTAPVVSPPAGSEVVDDWYPFWALARRLGQVVVFDGVPLDMTEPPTTDALLRVLARDGRVPFDELRRLGEGRVFDEIGPQYVEPGLHDARFDVMPTDVAAELQEVLRESGPDAHDAAAFTHRLAVRRLREVQNTMYHDLPAIRRFVRYNPACLNPEDLRTLGLEDGSGVYLVSPHGRIPAIVEADETVRPGVVSMSHGWGGTPGDGEAYEALGSNTGLLLSLARQDPINAMPQMSAIPVRIEPR